jgi:hypothetical protein
LLRTTEKCNLRLIAFLLSDLDHAFTQPIARARRRAYALLPAKVKRHKPQGALITTVGFLRGVHFVEIAA